jgi:hypothetical protein
MVFFQDLFGLIDRGFAFSVFPSLYQGVGTFPDNNQVLLGKTFEGFEEGFERVCFVNFGVGRGVFLHFLSPFFMEKCTTTGKKNIEPRRYLAGIYGRKKGAPRGFFKAKFDPQYNVKEPARP